MIVELDEYMKRMSKHLTDLDWMVISISYKASHEVNENSDMGRIITEMMNIYHQFLKTNDPKYEKILRKRYISYFYPNYSKQNVSVTTTYKQSMKVGGQPQNLPMKTVSKNEIEKEKKELFDSLESSERKQLLGEKELNKEDFTKMIQKLADKGTQELTNGRIDDLSSAVNEMGINQQQILMMLVQLMNESKQQSNTLAEISQDQGIVVNGMKLNRKTLLELKDMALGKLTMGGLLSAAFVGFAKVLFSVVKFVFSWFKWITIDVWWSPIRTFLKVSTKYASYILGGTMVIIIGTTIFTFYVNSNEDKMCYSPDIGYSKFCMYPSFGSAMYGEGSELLTTWLAGLIYVFKSIAYNMAHYPLGALGYTVEGVADSFTKITFGQMYHLDQSTFTYSPKEFIDNLWGVSLGKATFQYAADLYQFYGGNMMSLFNHVIEETGVKEKIVEQAAVVHEEIQEQYPLYKLASYMSSWLY